MILAVMVMNIKVVEHVLSPTFILAISLFHKVLVVIEWMFKYIHLDVAKGSLTYMHKCSLTHIQKYVVLHIYINI